MRCLLGILIPKPSSITSVRSWAPLRRESRRAARRMLKVYPEKLSAE
jgi:hypothetical protein